MDMSGPAAMKTFSVDQQVVGIGAAIIELGQSLRTKIAQEVAAPRYRRTVTAKFELHGPSEIPV
jgi:hypothetical protein